jgi:hypothetical protein
MTQKDNILKELSELKSTLANVTLQNVYTVPVGYFDGLAAQVLNSIKAMEAAHPVEELGYLSPMLSRISRQMPYAVPAGYFEGLAKKAMQSVLESSDYQTAKEEIETLSPLLSGLKKQMPYSVPQGYFETLTGKINTEENKPATRIISIASRKWFRYAAAAVVIGIITMAGFLFRGSNEKEPGGKALAKFTRDVKEMDDTQKDNLIDFIDMNNTETAQVDISNKIDEVKTLLQDISDEELKDFQEQTEDLEDVLMTN